MDTQQVAEAFSTHRFAEVHDRLADDVTWVVPGQPTVAAVDAIGRYESEDGGVSAVSSADVYEFDASGQVVVITSYAVEVDPD